MLAFCAAAFFLFGLVLVLPGASQNEMAQALELNLARSGLVASVLSIGLGAGVVIAGPLFDRLPRRPLFVSALLLAGLPLIFGGPEMSFPGWLLSIGIAGLGAGMSETLLNGAVAERYAGQPVRMLSAMHAAVTVGAALGPLLMGWIAARFHWSMSFVLIGCAYIALAGAAMAVTFPAHKRHDRPPRLYEKLLSYSMLPFALMLFGYVGIEGGLAIFASPYASEGLGLEASRGYTAISAFWVGMLIARITLALRHNAQGARVLIACGALGTGILVGAVSSGWPAIELVYFATGLALGGVFPMLIALTAQRFPHARGTATGFAVGVGSIGGFVVPWLTGALGDEAGIVIAFGSLALWPALIALTEIMLRKR